MHDLAGNVLEWTQTARAVNNSCSAAVRETPSPARLAVAYATRFYQGLPRELCRLPLRVHRPLPPLILIGFAQIVGIEMPHTAVNTDDLAGDKIRQLRGEKLNNSGTIFWLSHTTHGNLGQELS